MSTRYIAIRLSILPSTKKGLGVFVGGAKDNAEVRERAVVKENLPLNVPEAFAERHYAPFFDGAMTAKADRVLIFHVSCEGKKEGRGGSKDVSKGRRELNVAVDPVAVVIVGKEDKRAGTGREGEGWVTSHFLKWGPSFHAT